MLKAMWMKPACRKPPVTSRYHSPSATPWPCSPKSLTTEPLTVDRPPLPPAISARKASTLSPISTQVAGAPAPGERAGARGHAGPLARALRAAHADRGRRHALGADRPPAGGAGDAGLAIRVAVTGLRHGNRGAYNRGGSWPATARRRGMAGRKPREALRDAGRRRPRRRRHHRLLLQRLVRQPRRSRRRLRAPLASTAGTTSSTSSPGRSACSSPATPRASTPSGSASSTWCIAALGLHPRQRRRRSSASSRSTPRTTSCT